jgi:hypothetical protein
LEAERLEEQLRRRVVQLTHLVYLVDSDLDDGEVSEEYIEELRETTGALDSLIDELDDQFSE